MKRSERLNSNGATADRIAILGGGPIGLACALLLSARGIRSQLLDARTVEDSAQDRRLLALSRGTVQVLTGLLGPGFAPMALIMDVHVSSAGQLGATHLSSQDFSGNALGATVWYADLVRALARAAQAKADIAIRRPCRVLGLEQRPDSVLIQVDQAEPVAATIAINAEGTPAATADAAAAALLCDLEVQGLAAGTAVERFTREGPLALLPLPDGAGARDRKSMIWCLDQQLASERMALSDDQFTRKIQATLGPRIGRVVRAGPRSRFPLLPHSRLRLREHRLVYIGNAAQSLHPVAGQGFNLGIRDCVCLADCLAGTPQDPVSALSRYESTRKADRFAISRLTGALPGLFAARGAPIAMVRSIALVAFDLVVPARRSLSSVLMFGVRS